MTKYILPLALGALTLALSGCETDSPIFSSPATEAHTADVRGANSSDPGAGPSAAQEVRDIDTQRAMPGTLAGQSPAYSDPTAQPGNQMQSMNPYGH